MRKNTVQHVIHACLFFFNFNFDSFFFFINIFFFIDFFSTSCSSWCSSLRFLVC